MNQANAMLGLLTQTSLHAGAGNSAGVIDLPIQREGHNDWPCVFGSAVKGAWRSKAEGFLADDLEKVSLIFGPDTKNASEHAGALSVGDARLLLLPVRSLTSHFKWVTCHEALDRLKRDAGRLGLAKMAGFNVPAVLDDEVALMVHSVGDLFLEEYRFKGKISEDLGGIIDALASLMRRDQAHSVLEKGLVIVSNDLFAHLARHATPVNAHVALDANKTAKDGALWYEETLPPETLLYVCASASNARKKDVTLGAREILDAATRVLFGTHPWLQLGGNETVGMGWCAVSILGMEG